MIRPLGKARPCFHSSTLQHARVLAVGVDAGVARDLGAVHQLERLLEHDPEPGGGLRRDLAKRLADDEAIRLLGRSDPALVGLGDQAVPDREVIRVGDVVELAQHGGVAQAEVHGRGLGDRDEAPGREAARGLERPRLALEQAVVGRVAPGDRRDHDRRRDEQRERRAREAPPRAALRAARLRSRRPARPNPGAGGSRPAAAGAAAGRLRDAARRAPPAGRRRSRPRDAACARRPAAATPARSAGRRRGSRAAAARRRRSRCRRAPRSRRRAAAPSEPAKSSRPIAQTSAAVAAPSPDCAIFTAIGWGPATA